jgi:predicted nucleic acid-binding protein
MNVIDSSGWLAYFAGGRNANIFAPVVKATDNLVVPTVCIYEVFKRMLTQQGEEDALQAIGIMSLGTIADMTCEIAINAANLSFELKIAMADSIILATTRAYHATLWTQDREFEGMERVQYVA